LEGYLRQDDSHFELIVADDGSTEDTRILVHDFARRASFPIRHVWHEDQGFRLSAIRNLAVAATQADYLILTDGDCVPLPSFVSQHRALAEPSFFLSGNRVLLEEQFTQQVLALGIPIHAWSFSQWVRARLQGKINRLLPLLHLPLSGSLRRSSEQRWQGAKTCNLSLWRQDFVAVNGMDEAYAGWGMDDSDLVVRLYHQGIRRKSARFAAPVLHLWHHESDRARLAANMERFESLLRSRRTRAELGIDRYLARA
jgi:glycosyltransferase involved in cell wall biosynthesis